MSGICMSLVHWSTGALSNRQRSDLTHTQLHVKNPRTHIIQLLSVLLWLLQLFHFSTFTQRNIHVAQSTIQHTHSELLHNVWMDSTQVRCALKRTLSTRHFVKDYTIISEYGAETEINGICMGQRENGGLESCFLWARLYSSMVSGQMSAVYGLNIRY